MINFINLIISAWVFHNQAILIIIDQSAAFTGVSCWLVSVGRVRLRTALSWSSLLAATKCGEFRVLENACSTASLKWSLLSPEPGIEPLSYILFSFETKYRNSSGKWYIKIQTDWQSCGLGLQKGPMTNETLPSSQSHEYSTTVKVRCSRMVFTPEIATTN